MDVTRLLNFLQQKISTLEHHPHEDQDVYSERNLSLEILKFIKELAEKEKQKADLFSSYPYAPPTFPQAPQFQYYKYTSNTIDDTICEACKVSHPGHTHCIHKLRY